jgi:hypothetical protein
MPLIRRGEAGPVEILLKRDIAGGIYRLSDICPNVSTVPEIAQMLEERKLSSEFIDNIEIEIEDPCDYYAYVNDKEGRIMLCKEHLSKSDEKVVYLDIVHETVHIIQLHDGRNLFDRRYRYSRRPTEIEAYRVAVNEGRRIGMKEQELFDYLKVEWISEEEHRELASKLGVRPSYLL